MRAIDRVSDGAAAGARRETRAACRGLDGGLSIDALCWLERRLHEAFNDSKPSVPLRRAVERLVARLSAAGASPAATMRVLRYVVQHEAEPYRLNHGSLITGRQPCDRLIGAVLRYATDTPALRVCDTK